MSSQYFLKKGSQVEVGSDAEDCWFRATIIDYSSKPSSSKKRKQALVKYNTLFSEDNLTLLMDYVDLSHIRPLPPHTSPNLVFQENDVVDAAYKYGWWIGVVRKVLQGFRYLVYFNNPPDVLEFSAQDLRPHWDWSNGKWIRPPKQQTIGSIYSPGTSVEVNIEHKGVHDAWFPALALKEYADGTVLVKYRCTNIGNDAEPTKTIVKSSCIRPVPPFNEDRDYELLETVDVRFELGWRPGDIRKIFAGRRYGVSLDRGNERKELDHSEIRPHVDWVDGKWISKSKKALIVPDNGERFQEGLSCIANKEGTVRDNSDGVTLSSIATKNLMVKSLNFDKKLSFSNKKKKLADNNHNAQSGPSEILTEVNSDQGPLSAAEPTTDEALSNSGTVKVKSRNRKKTKDVDQNTVISGIFATGKQVRTKQQKRVELECGKSERVTKKGRHAKSPSRSPEALVSAKANKVVDMVHQDVNNNEDGGVAGEQTTETSVTDCISKEVDMPVIGISKEHVVNDDNRALALFFGGTQSLKNGLPSCKSANGWSNTEGRHIELVVEGDAMPHQNNCLPFTKQSPFWKTIESWEVFQLVPQNPHFAPLAEQREEFREGSAIGLMVTFAGLLEKIASLQFDYSRNRFESIAESFMDLEKHGFDVTLPLSRVNEMLSMKDRQGELLNKSQGAEKELRVQSEERRELTEKITAINMMISNLEQELSTFESMMKSKELQISDLHSNVDGMSTKINKVQDDFKKIVTAPWNISR